MEESVTLEVGPFFYYPQQIPPVSFRHRTVGKKKMNGACWGRAPLVLASVTRSSGDTAAGAGAVLGVTAALGGGYVASE